MLSLYFIPNKKQLPGVSVFQFDFTYSGHLLSNVFCTVGAVVPYKFSVPSNDCVAALHWMLYKQACPAFKTSCGIIRTSSFQRGEGLHVVASHDLSLKIYDQSMQRIKIAFSLLKFTIFCSEGIGTFSVLFLLCFTGSTMIFSHDSRLLCIRTQNIKKDSASFSSITGTFDMMICLF